MGSSISFQADRPFLGEKHFPHGIARSGHFSSQQAKLLETHGYAYLALSKGERKPIDQLEKDFVAFCKGEKDAESIHEKIWQRYLDCTTKKNLCHYSVGAVFSGNDSDFSASEFGE